MSINHRKNFQKTILRSNGDNVISRSLRHLRCRDVPLASKRSAALSVRTLSEKRQAKPTKMPGPGCDKCKDKCQDCKCGDNCSCCDSGCKDQCACKSGGKCSCKPCSC
ncbi:hypothetical protein PUN28_013184 [Cardiocondyla obscurior]|uniref:Metallothionein n=1 Tax=Cardiocondyla obscurior TaxID=286306 RepID=A0AAW2FCA6_9HYME